MKKYQIKRKFIKKYIINTKKITKKVINTGKKITKKNINTTGNILDGASEILINTVKDEEYRKYMKTFKELGSASLKITAKTPVVVKTTVLVPFNITKKVSNYKKCKQRIKQQQQQITEIKKELKRLKTLQKKKNSNENVDEQKIKSKSKTLRKNINNIKRRESRKDISVLKNKLGVGVRKNVKYLTNTSIDDMKSNNKQIRNFIIRKALSENSEGATSELLKNIAMKNATSGLKLGIKGIIDILKTSIKLAIKTIIKGATAIGLPFTLILLLCVFYLLFYSDFSFDFNNGSDGMSNAVSVTYDSPTHTNNTVVHMEELIAQSINNIVSSPTYNENETTIRTTTEIESLTETDIDVLTDMLYIGILTNESAYEDGDLKEHFLSGNANDLTTYLLTENINVINNALEKCVKYTETEEETIINNSELIGNYWVNVTGLRNYISPIQTSYKKCIVSSDSVIPLRSLLKINGELYKVVEKKAIVGDYEIEVINELSDTIVYHYSGYVTTLPTDCNDYTRFYKCGGHQTSIESTHNNGLLMTQDEFNASGCNNYNIIPTFGIIGFTGGGVPIYSDVATNKYLCKGHTETNTYYDFEGYQTFLPVNCTNTEIYYQCNGTQETQGNVNLEIGSYATYFHTDSSDTNSPQRIVIKDITINADIKTIEEIKTENINNKDFIDKLKQLEETKNN